MDLTWVCLEITEPADAVPYAEVGSLGTRDVRDAVQAVADAWVDPACVADCSDHWWTCAEAECTTEDGVSVAYSYTYEDDCDSSCWDEWIWSYAIEVPEGEADFTSLTLGREDDHDADFHWEYSDSEWSAGWTGTPDGAWPSDAAVWARWYEGDAWGHSMLSEVEEWSDGACAWTALWERDGTWQTWTITLPSAEVRASYGQGSNCGTWYSWAWLDDVFWGCVDPKTWETVACTDADGDDHYAEDDDCDDTDATIHACAYDVASDGIDQDCDGADREPTDADGDGHARTYDGGDDCDDGDATIHPDATEVECDGIDQDCDKADVCDTGAPADSGYADTAAEADSGVATESEEAPASDPRGCGGGCAVLFLVLGVRTARYRPRSRPWPHQHRLHRLEQDEPIERG